MSACKSYILWTISAEIYTTQPHYIAVIYLLNRCSTFIWACLPYSRVIFIVRYVVCFNENFRGVACKSLFVHGMRWAGEMIVQMLVGQLVWIALGYWAIGLLGYDKWTRDHVLGVASSWKLYTSFSFLVVQFLWFVKTIPCTCFPSSMDDYSYMLNVYLPMEDPGCVLNSVFSVSLSVCLIAILRKNTDKIFLNKLIGWDET